MFHLQRIGLLEATVADTCLRNLALGLNLELHSHKVDFLTMPVPRVLIFNSVSFIFNFSDQCLELDNAEFIREAWKMKGFEKQLQEFHVKVKEHSQNLGEFRHFHLILFILA